MNAADIIRIKELLPTAMGSDELREQVAADILRRSVFSARMESARYLARVRDVCAQFADGAINSGDARLALMDELARMGHSPTDGGGITNPASVSRINLVVKTQRRMAASVARLNAQTETSVGLFPAWELTRFSGRRAPREDWDRRWTAAGNAVGWNGALRRAGDWPDWKMVALKSSPIWEALGNGAGGFRDTLGNPYPPFAYGSGLSWLDVSRADCEKYGLIGSDEKVDAPEPASLSPADREIAEAARLTGFDDLLEGLA